MEKISRICYNDQGWLFPSGRKDKAVNKFSFEQINGFGYEEWLLDYSKLIDGYHYAFLQPLNGYHHAGKIYDIHLFFYTKSFGKVYVGCIKNAECIDDSEAKRALSIYKEKKWYDEMLTSIRNVGGDPNLLKSEKHNIFNIKFRPKDFEDHTSNPLHISQDDPSTRGLYYKLMDKHAPFVFDENFGSITHVSKRSGRLGTNRKSEKTVRGGVYERADYNPIHNEVQNKVEAILKLSGDYTDIRCEEDYVDIKATYKTGDTHFFEIKTNTARLSIREALGQILEYSDYPCVSNASKLIIISVKPLDSLDLKYMQHLRSKYHIPVWYRYFSFEDETLGDEQ